MCLCLRNTTVARNIRAPRSFPRARFSPPFFLFFSSPPFFPSLPPLFPRARSSVLAPESLSSSSMVIARPLRREYRASASSRGCRGTLGTHAATRPAFRFSSSSPFSFPFSGLMKYRLLLLSRITRMRVLHIVTRYYFASSASQSSVLSITKSDANRKLS